MSQWVTRSPIELSWTAKKKEEVQGGQNWQFITYSYIYNHKTKLTCHILQRPYNRQQWWGGSILWQACEQSLREATCAQTGNMFCKRVESTSAPHLLTMQIRGQPSPAEILDIVLEGELLGIGEPLGGGEVDEEESREEKQHLGRKLSVEIVPLVHRKCISGIWLNQFRKYLPRPVISKLSVSVRNSTIANLECMYKADFAAIGANQRRRSQSASSKRGGHFKADW